MDWNDFIDGLKFCGFAILFAAIVLPAICFPVAWMDGHAKSAFLKQTQGIDIPWYQATWLSVETNTVDLKQHEQPKR